MPEQLDKTFRIHLHQLTEKDAAVLNRVVNFSISQGKPYVLTSEIAASHIVVVAGDTLLPNWQGGKIIRIHPHTITEHEVLLPPPLLVTRVMRVIDETIQTLPLNNHEGFQVCTTTQTTADTPPNIEQQAKDTSPVLPLNTVSETISPEPTEPESTEPAKTLALIIDDSLAIRTQLAIELRSMNIASDQAESGEQALLMIEKTHYHMIFLDIIMPGIDGYEVCKQIRKRPDTRKTPIIMLSGKDSPLDEVKGILAGATTYLTKPVKSDRLKQTTSRIARWVAEFS